MNIPFRKFSGFPPSNLLLLLCLGLFFCTDLSGEELNAKANELALDTREQRELDFVRISKLLTKARESVYKSNYSEASESYRKAERMLNKIGGELAAFKKRALKVEIRKFKSNWASYLMKKARRAKLQKKFEDAINFAAEATLIDVNRNSEVDEFIAACKKARKGIEFRRKTTLANFSGKVLTNAKEVESLYREAEVFYKNRKYDKVRKLLEEVFLIDPYHKKSIRLLGDTYQQMFRYGEKRRVADVRGMLAYNTWTWIDPILPTHFERDDTTSTLTVKRNIASSTYAKLERIVFPNIEFDDADIFSVIRFLNRLSKRCDPDKVGVSVIAGFDKSTADQLLKVTMSFSNIPMSEVLRYLCQNVGLKYKIEEGAVILGTSVDEMQTEYFPVRADLIASITGTEVGADGESGKSDDEDMTEKEADFFDVEKTFEKDKDKKSTKISLSSQALIKFFEDRGVKFGRGATIAYSRRSGKLVVRNSLINLRRLEDLLRQYELINTPLVLIEVKFIEIGGTDIQQLGFRWDFSFTKGTEGESGSWGVTGDYDPLRYFTNGQATSTTYSSTTAIPFKVLNQLKILPNFGQGIFPNDVSADLSLSIQAVAKNTRSETLSSPKIITTSGHEAVIRMVEERYFPSSWENPEITVNNNTVQLQAPIPEFDDSTDIGIRLTVTPIVNPDNYTITLHVKPEVVSFIDYSKYPITLEQGTLDADGQPVPSIQTTYEIKMPIIGRRDIDTHVKVYDGETIVLGGMINNRIVYRDDKWPIIGDIPLIGRLFSSQLAYTNDLNLLIFLTARLINSDGVPVRSGKQHGKPDFYR
jgi:Flp pilus assembly secretin CpaC/tetratricopeptide (TPR) repeat protein